MEQSLPAFERLMQFVAPKNKYLPLSLWVKRDGILQMINDSRTSEDKKIKKSAKNAFLELNAYNLQAPRCSECDNVAKYYKYCKSCKTSIYSKCSAHDKNEWHYMHICY